MGSVLVLAIVPASRPVPTGRPVETSEESSGQGGTCQWRSQVPVLDLNRLMRVLTLTKHSADEAYDSTCSLMMPWNPQLCTYLRSRARHVDTYPRFDPRIIRTCDVQEVGRAAVGFVERMRAMTGHFRDDVLSQFPGRPCSSTGLCGFLARLRNVRYLLAPLVRGSEASPRSHPYHHRTSTPATPTPATPTLTSTSSTTTTTVEDITSRNIRNLRIPAHASYELSAMLDVFQAIIDRLSDQH
ncbi:uncharacterized protein LOC143301079 [Babylonia areolata]|uniref:uncharacterized protein LOC143301079 n=1 Tax=Babylonia areolata TaxID=304850 RepID=UPI003FD2655D